jgi:CHASE3 domain sensor protein
MRSMSIRAKLVFGFGVLVTITLVQGGAAYRGMLIVDNSASEIERQTVARSLAESIFTLALKQDSVVRAFLLTGDENALVAQESARRSYEKTMDELAPEIESEEGRQFLGRIQQRGNAYLSLGEREIELKRQKKIMMRSNSCARRRCPLSMLWRKQHPNLVLTCKRPETTFRGAGTATCLLKKSSSLAFASPA